MPTHPPSGEPLGDSALPPNVAAAREILLEDGPASPAELRAKLQSRGILLREATLAALPVKYSHMFSTDSGDRIIALRSRVARDIERDTSEEVAHLLEPLLEPWSRDQVVVFDLETTGLNHDVDEIWAIAARNLGTGAEYSVRVSVTLDSPRVPPLEDEEVEIPIAEALAGLKDIFNSVPAISGHNIANFDVPFIRRVAERIGMSWVIDKSILDLTVLSTLALPNLDGRTLEELVHVTGVPHGEFHLALDDTRATAAVIESLLDHIDPSSASWSVASMCLARAGNDWPRLFPAFTNSDREAALTPPEDVLSRVQPTPKIENPAQWVRDAFTKLNSSRSGFRSRPSQLEMSEAVVEVMRDGELLAVEAPTGTGKSLAYLLPALARATRGVPVVVATATKVLQQQLRGDAEGLLIDGLLTVPVRQISGVSNYICPREINSALDDVDIPPEEWTAVAVGIRALSTSESGVWSEVSDWMLRSNSPGYVKRRIALATTSNDCERRSCEHVGRCPLYRRLEGIGETPGVIIANHALMGAWADGRRRGRTAPGDVFSEDRADLIIDEAHDLEDTLTSAWTESTTGFDLEVVEAVVFGRNGPVRASQRAARDIGNTAAIRETVQRLMALDEELRAATRGLHKAIQSCIHEFGGPSRTLVLVNAIHGRRAEFRQVQAKIVEARTAIRDIAEGLNALAAILKPDSVNGEEAPAASASNQPQTLSIALRRIFGVRRDLLDLVARLTTLRDLPDDHAFVHVLSTNESVRDRSDAGWEFERIPINISEIFRDDVVEIAHSVTLTSATLTVNGSFDFLASRLGLLLEASPVTIDTEEEKPAERIFNTRMLESPFLHDDQSAVVLTSHLPFPSPANELEFCEELAADQVGLLSLTHGRMLTLFAARSRMEKVAELVSEHSESLAERGVRVLVQGDASPQSIARQFRADPGTVVYGLRSYWQGFDAPGDTLSYLALEKPPYPHPGDPVAAARQRSITEAGGDAFMDYIVPRTAITFAQGFGRLIRHEEDRGAAIVYDRRMHLPTVANGMILGTLPTNNHHYAFDRDDAWNFAIEFVTGEAPDLTSALLADFDRVASILSEVMLEEGEDPEIKLRRAALELFGIAHLRDEQLQIMRAMLEGRDVLGILPTGFGKSLCFQLPSMLAYGDGVTVVVSPLVALIKDQVDELRGRRGFRAVHGITGATSATERTEIMRDISGGRTRLLYVSPERFVRDATMLRALEQSNVRAVVIDEAHCVSVWGPDFRPEFRLIDRAVADLPRCSRIALTATATPEVEADVISALALDRPLIVRRPVDRPNLRFTVRKIKTDKDRARELLRIVSAMGDKPGIVYAGRRATTEEVAWILRQARISARAYHAGLLREQRDSIQEDFLSGQTQVIVATKAFGMGVNKPDIGWVLHYDLPESLEGYAQEAGRAGRDPSIDADCVLVYSNQDLKRRRMQIGRADATADLADARKVLRAIGDSRKRGEAHIFDPDELADRSGADVEDLNVILAWLERTGNAMRLTDQSMRGTVSKGFREPADEEDRKEFRRLFATVLRTKPNMRKLVDFNTLEDEHGIDAEDLEEMMVRWTMAGLVVFNTSQRGWRVKILNPIMDEQAYLNALKEWREWERRRLDAMIDYAEKGLCRRVSVAHHFGDDKRVCGEIEGSLPCDVCSGLAPAWSSIPDSHVPDPESLIRVDVVALQAIRWSSAYRHGRYSEGGIKAAILGTETLGGRPIGAGLLGCPQFGALRYLRAGERRLNEAVEHLVNQGLLVREATEYQGRSYSTMQITDVGKKFLMGQVA